MEEAQSSELSEKSQMPKTISYKIPFICDIPENVKQYLATTDVLSGYCFTFSGMSQINGIL